MDALGLIGQLLDTISFGSTPAPAKNFKYDSGYRRFDFGAGSRTSGSRISKLPDPSGLAGQGRPQQALLHV